MPRYVSWDEAEELDRMLAEEGLTLLNKRPNGFVWKNGRRFLVQVAPGVEIWVDTTTPMTIPHRGGIRAVLDTAHE